MKLEDFLEHEDEEINKVASILTAAETAYQSGNITKEQFDELANDAIENVKIDQLADSLERKIMLQEAIEHIKTIVGAITK